MMRRLDPELIRQLFETAIELELYDRREVLLLGIPRHFLATIPVVRRMQDQLRLDLDAFNNAGILRDGSDPFRIWLTNAIDAAGGVQEDALIRRVRDDLSVRSLDSDVGPHPAPPIDDFGGSGSMRPTPSRQGEDRFYPLIVPPLGESITEVAVTRWLKKPGDRVSVYELLLEIETDKVDYEIYSPVAGYLRFIDKEANETAEVGVRLARIEVDRQQS